MAPTPGQTFPYKIDFENASTASAPAQRVVITSTLNANLKWNTFEFTSFGFGDTNLTVESHRQHYENQVPMTYNGQTFNVGGLQPGQR